MSMIPRFRAFASFFLLLSLSMSGATEIRVVAWNIEWFPGQQARAVTPEMEREHMQRVQAEVKRMNPDILLGSEIRDWRAFAELVSAVPGMQVANVSHFVDRDEGVLWRQQLAIGSRLPIMAAYAEPFRQTLGALVRGFSFAAINVPGSDDVILVYALHLKSNRSFNEQQAQVNFRVRDESIVQLLQHIDQMERLKWRGRIAGVIVGGDINTNEDGQFGDNVVKLMTDAGFRNTWEDVPREDRLTWRGSDRFEATTFDYIFVRGDRLRARNALMIEVPANTSDHHAVGLIIAVDD